MSRSRDNAREKGRQARLDGKDRFCPFSQRDSAIVTAWCEGYDDADHELRLTGHGQKKKQQHVAPEPTVVKLERHEWFAPGFEPMDWYPPRCEECGAAKPLDGANWHVVTNAAPRGRFHRAPTYCGAGHVPKDTADCSSNGKVRAKQ